MVSSSLSVGSMFICVELFCVRVGPRFLVVLPYLLNLNDPKLVEPFGIEGDSKAR